jgi:aminoglycoside 2'-N-acetyltransferase I
MSIEIDVLNGDVAWKTAEPLFNAVWPPDVLEKLS